MGNASKASQSLLEPTVLWQSHWLLGKLVGGPCWGCHGEEGHHPVAQDMPSSRRVAASPREPGIQDRAVDKKVAQEVWPSCLSLRVGCRSCRALARPCRSALWCTKPQGENGDNSRAQGVSGDLVMFTDATPPLSKHGGWPRLRATPGEATKLVHRQGEHGGLLAQGRLRRSTDPGKQTAGSAAGSSLARLWAQVALKLAVSVGKCCAHGASRDGGSWEPPVPGGSHQFIPEPGSSAPSLSFHPVQRGKSHLAGARQELGV